MKDSLEKIKLISGAWKAELLPEYASSLFSLSFDDEDIIRKASSDAEFMTNHIVYGTAFLLPPDRTIGGNFFFEGKEYFLPINDSRGISNLHGLMTDAPFELISRDEAHAVLRYRNSGERYPFPFEVTVSCSLEDGCKMEYAFTNTGETNMPLLFGLHANFTDMGFVKVPVRQEMPMNMETLVPDEIPGPLSKIGAEFAVGVNPTGTEISGFFTAGGYQAEIGKYTYTISDNFTHWVVWNDSGNDGFISVEPENGPVNGLKMDGVCAVLKKGETITYETIIRRKNYE